ncbi:DUF547 domain-containing protein [Adhaeribacter aerolatus]|uniref:DUF547 domain-containing protein n=1 Tax=Adhaeribacter aerolatus TaxID=670289 RepID=A0A512AY20_9BACT|nr:DUF547 domain-containing protein [Adhaeribacter aerolatus]GEO04616.1 DUF547 domain-containing protein [Adhaeribacter aerolatus]
MKKIVLLLLIYVAVQTKLAAQTPVSHEAFTRLLKQHVNTAGNVNYKGFIKDSTQLNVYLKQLSANPPQKNWSKNDQLAYWINAYNAFTIQLIIRHYPLKSIKDIGSIIKIPFVNTPWDIKFIRIGRNTYDLNNIEHDILRKNFNEPRIHFAIVCASVSCPKLLNEAFVVARVEQQLEAQAKDFINDPSRNKITPAKAQLSSIFSWFKDDFTKQGNLVDFINKYASFKLRPNASITYLDYNWNLNE